MIDIELIKENYARMPDEKLTIVLKQDGTSITYEAFIILKREYNKRKLDPTLLAEIEKARLEQSKAKVQSNFKREEIIIENKLWMGVIRLKADNKTDQEIVDWLISEGVQPVIAVDGIKEIEAVTRNCYKRASKAMLVSFLFFFGGLALSWVGVDTRNTSYLLYGIILLITPIRFVYTNNKTYRLCEKAMEVIKQEKNEE